MYTTNNFPTSIQNPTKPVATDDTAVFDHAGLEDFQNDSIYALKTKVGANNSTDPTSIDYILNHPAAIAALIPDASTTQKGVVKTTTSNSIVASTDDTRIPTQNENDALIGTSGTNPSSSNKFVDNADTNGTGAVVRTSILTGYQATGITIPAGETIVAGQPVYIGYYDTTEVTYDSKVAIGNSWSGSSQAVSIPIAVGNNSNRYLVVCISVGLGNGSPGNLSGVTSVNFGGNSMTLLQSNTSGGCYDLLYGISAPVTGTNNLTFTITASSGGSNGAYVVSAYSYYNCNSTPSFSGKNTSGSPGTGVSASNGIYDNTLAFITANTTGASGTWTSTALTSQTQSANSSASYIMSGSTSTIDINGSQTISFTPTVNLSSCNTVFYVSLASSVTPTAGYAKLTSAAKSGYSDRYLKFIGFASNGGSATQNILIVTDGIINGLTSLTSNSIYYLGDTSGTISTSAGTNSKKIGLSISTTSLVLKDSI